MTYPTILRCWDLLLLDNVPAQIRLSPETSFDAMMVDLSEEWSPDDLEIVEAALAFLEEPELEDLCMGDEDEQDRVITRLNGAGYQGNLVNDLIDEMFELTDHGVLTASK